MFGVNPLRKLMNTPVPVPSVVWFPAVAGFGDVLQHTPLAVTIAPPSVITLPPLVAVVWVMFVTVAVVTVGNVVTLPLSFKQRTDLPSPFRLL